MKHILTWLAVFALVAVALSAEIPRLKNKEPGPGAAGDDLKTASTFIGPLGYGWGWGYPYFGYGWGWGFGGYPYWG